MCTTNLHGTKVESIISKSSFIPSYLKDKDKDKDPFIGPQEFVVGYSKAPKQTQSSAGPICHSPAMTSTGREPAIIHIAAYRSSLSYALHYTFMHSGDTISYTSGV